MTQRIRVSTENLKKNAEFFQQLADDLVSAGAKVFQGTAGLRDYNGQLPANVDALRTQHEANDIGMELKADSERLIALAELFEKVDNEAVEGFEYRPSLPPFGLRGYLKLPVNWAMTTSKCGIGFIAVHEDVDKPFYPLGPDPAGNCQVGIGHWLHRGPCDDNDRARWGSGLSKEKAQALLAEDVKKAELIVKNSVTVKLTQAQFDALVSLAYNLGKIPEDVLVAVNAGDFEKAGELMQQYVYGNDGVQYGGLITRRADERNLMETGLYGNEFCDFKFEGGLDAGGIRGGIPHPGIGKAPPNFDADGETGKP
jgi:GH24 family phage-related lysozyme (muramidase)